MCLLHVFPIYTRFETFDDKITRPNWSSLFTFCTILKLFHFTSDCLNIELLCFEGMQALFFYPRCSNRFESHMHFKSIATYHLETCDEIWMKCWWIYFYRFCIEIYNSSVFVRIGNIILPYFQLKRIIFLLTRLPVMASASF